MNSLWPVQAISTWWQHPWTSDQSAAIQVITAVAQAVLTIAALGIAIGVPWWQERNRAAEEVAERLRKAAEDAAEKAGELAALRIALQTEAMLIAKQCQLELEWWLSIVPDPFLQNVTSVHLQPLLVYRGNIDKIGLLTRNEIVSLVSFSGTLHDLEMVSRQLSSREEEERIEENQQRIITLLKHACRTSADFLEASPVPVHPEEHRQFIKKLRESQNLSLPPNNRSPKAQA